jgi:TonB family protein
VQGTVVVSMTSADSLNAWIYSMHKNNEGYYPRSLRELDAIPAPITAPPPAYPQSLVQSGHGGNVTVKFYIDETGAVRLPAVDSSDDWELSGLAITALNKWRFEPPTCKGLPVLAKVSQVFRFRPSAGPAARTGNSG